MLGEPDGVEPQLLNQFGLVQTSVDLLLIPAVVELHQIEEVAEFHGGFLPVMFGLWLAVGIVLRVLVGWVDALPVV